MKNIRVSNAHRNYHVVDIANSTHKLQMYKFFLKKLDSCKCCFTSNRYLIFSDKSFEGKEAIVQLVPLILSMIHKIMTPHKFPIIATLILFVLTGLFAYFVPLPNKSASKGIVFGRQ